ncbi:MAG TPA: hypothetical protein HA232_03035, partial [Methanocellales archaeon]|nr:hypothetical protein [Methanocellales archaeon]
MNRRERCTKWIVVLMVASLLLVSITPTLQGAMADNGIVDDEMGPSIVYSEYSELDPGLESGSKPIQIILEREISLQRKTITIYSNSDKEVIAHTKITDAPRDSIKLYRTTEGTREPVRITEYLDTNNNGLVD